MNTEDGDSGEQKLVHVEQELGEVLDVGERASHDGRDVRLRESGDNSGCGNERLAGADRGDGARRRRAGPAAFRLAGHLERLGDRRLRERRVLLQTERLAQLRRERLGFGRRAQRDAAQLHALAHHSNQQLLLLLVLRLRAYASSRVK